MGEPVLEEIEEHDGVKNEYYPLPERLPLADDLNVEVINEPAPIMDREDICNRLWKIYHDWGLTHEAVQDAASLLNDFSYFIPKRSKVILSPNNIYSNTPQITLNKIWCVQDHFKNK